MASFSTLKYINSQYFQKFRENFKAKFLKGFAVPADTFDNVNGEFPIGFLIWNLAKKENLKQISVDIFERGDKFLGQKGFYAIPKNSFIIDWLRNFHDKKGEKLTYLRMQGTDFSNNRGCFLANDLSKNDFIKRLFTIVTPKNLIPFCVYLTVRHAIPRTWINDRDQFLYPNDKWQKDTEFHNDCLAFTLFHNQNYIKASISPSSAEGDKGGGYSGYINHFIPFSESQVGAKEAFKSDFMVRFINGKLGKEDTASSLRASKASAASAYEGEAQSKIHKNNIDCHDFAPAKSRNDNILPFDKKEIQANTQNFIPTKPLEFSKEAKEVFSAGLALWRYYHAQAKNSDSYLNDASLYDIKEYFQGRAESINGKKGKMNARSEDNHYNDLIAQLRITLQTLADKITPKIYEYEFLLE